MGQSYMSTEFPLNRAGRLVRRASVAHVPESGCAAPSLLALPVLALPPRPPSMPPIPELLPPSLSPPSALETLPPPHAGASGVIASMTASQDAPRMTRSLSRRQKVREGRLWGECSRVGSAVVVAYAQVARQLRLQRLGMGAFTTSQFGPASLPEQSQEPVPRAGETHDGGGGGGRHTPEASQYAQPSGQTPASGSKPMHP